MPDKESAILTHDAGAPRDIMMPFYRATVPHSYVGWGKTTHLGFGIPLMIGAKLARPDAFCLNFMGDGAFGMSGLDLETSVRIGAPITTIVLNNGDMATYPGGYPEARARFNMTHMTGDYAKIAEGLGAVGIVVKQPSEIAAALAARPPAQRRRADRPARHPLQPRRPPLPLRRPPWRLAPTAPRPSVHRRAAPRAGRCAVSLPCNVRM